MTTRTNPTRRDFHRLFGATAVATVGGSTLWLAGCSQRQALSGEALKDLKLGIIAKAKDNPVFRPAIAGAEAKAAELTKAADGSVQLEERSPDREGGEAQAQIIEQLVGSGYHGIAIACSDASKVVKPINEAIRRGVVVMCWDSDCPESDRLCYVGTDDYEAGRRVASEVATRLGDRQGQVAILAGNQNATNLQARVRGAREVLAEHPNLKLFGEQGAVYHEENPARAYQQVERVYSNTPDLIGWAMIGGWPLMTDTPMPWAKDNNPRDLVCVSMDTLPPQLEHLRKGEVEVLYGQQYYQFGQKCVEILVNKIRENNDPEQEDLRLPLDEVTQENLDEYTKKAEAWQ